MNPPQALAQAATTPCRELALAALGALLRGAPAADDAPEARFLHEAWRRAGAHAWPHEAQRALAAPQPQDDALLRLAALLRLSAAETLVVALAAAVEDDALVGRLLAWLQGAPQASRPSLSLLARALAPLGADVARYGEARAEAELVYALAYGNAVRAGALLLDGDERPLVERSLRLPGPLAAALAGIDVDWPGTADDGAAAWASPAGTLAGRSAAAAEEAGGDPSSNAGAAAGGSDTAIRAAALRPASAATAPGDPRRTPQRARDDERAPLDAWAARLAAQDDAALVIRSAHPGEARALAAALAQRLGRRIACFAAGLPAAADLWLALTGRLAVFTLDAAPLEPCTVPRLRHGRGPLLVLAAPDVAVRRDDGVLAEWRVPPATFAARQRLWRAALGDPAAADAAARRALGTPAQVAETARLAQLLCAPPTGSAPAACAGGEPPDRPPAAAASGPGPGQAADRADPAAAEGSAADGASVAADGTRAGAVPLTQALRMTAACRALDSLAEALPEPVADDALVLGAALRAELLRVLQRCEQREALHDALGPAARVRAGPGVRVLFTGASGTGKSLAAQWLATRLQLPIYRVDLASMLSKWIGETEKNLAELLTRAEAAGVVLLFDEADTLFGKRTEVTSANDRFANAQTNYLLQRIESFGGIAVLTSNSRSRFDPAFVRRLDLIVDFAAPDAQARRALWCAHLGERHALDAQQLNRLAALADLAGGQVRNAVLAAAAAAAAQGGPIAFEQVADGVRAEYRKLGRSAPLEL